MDITTQFVHSSNTTADTLRKGGILLKGRTRATRQPVHMIMTVDTSGSMDLESKLQSVKRSLQILLVLLTEEDRLSLITFDDTSKVVLNRVTPTTQEREAISYRIASLRTDGSTNMSAGLLDARDLAEDAAVGRKQGLLLLTDGHANMGVSDVPGLVAIIRRILTEKPGLSVTTVGYGSDHNTELLTEIAKEGGGAYNVVNSLEDVATTFGDVLGGLVSVSAQRVTLEFPPGYKVQTSYAMTVEPSGFTRVSIGDLYAETEITVLYEGSPSLGPIRVTGTDMSTLDRIDTIVSPTLVDTDDDYMMAFVVAQYRAEVTEILGEIRKRASSVPREKIQALLQQIRENARIAAHPIVPFLIEDLETVSAIHSAGGMMSQEQETELAQHSAYIGMTRGLRTTTTQVSYQAAPPRVRGIGLARQVGRTISSPAGHSLAPPDSPPTSPTLGAMPHPPVPSLFASPTANAQQRHMASVMRTMSSQPPDEV
jgi:Mg-chelatase subunit ChlD